MAALDEVSSDEDAPVAMREARKHRKGIPARVPSSAITSGMVVTHAMSDIAATEGTILTLKDKSILTEEGNNLDLDDIDELER